MNYRPYQQIERRKSRLIHVGRVPVGGDSPDHRADDDQHADHRRRGHGRADPPVGEGGRGHRPRVLPRPGERAGAEGDRGPGRCADRGGHPLPLQARHRGGPERRRLPAHQSRQHRQPRARAGGDQGRPRPWLLHAHRRECRQSGAASAGEIRRAEPGGAGRKRAGARQDPAGQRLPRVQDQREGVRRVHGRGRLSATGRTVRPPAAHRHHRGRAASARAR